MTAHKLTIVPVPTPSPQYRWSCSCNTQSKTFFGTEAQAERAHGDHARALNGA
ncbi:hypothetical protein [Nonomuraea rubra]|uniref:Uncharacterized protein n=1 Tax=Nonomuraea rubra TaxID=46180 RepID=A0A7X0P6C9_9ACTN|nr:hypothetical protein [Nonomuraea rubra]MBB6556100.1 hypothetical protein [Nonomuraea rubra]